MDELEKMYMKQTRLSEANMYSVFRETGGFKYLDLFYMYAKHFKITKITCISILLQEQKRPVTTLSC